MKLISHRARNIAPTKNIGAVRKPSDHADRLGHPADQVAGRPAQQGGGDQGQQGRSAAEQRSRTPRARRRPGSSPGWPGRRRPPRTAGSTAAPPASGCPACRVMSRARGPARRSRSRRSRRPSRRPGPRPRIGPAASSAVTSRVRASPTATTDPVTRTPGAPAPSVSARLMASSIASSSRGRHADPLGAEDLGRQLAELRRRQAARGRGHLGDHDLVHHLFEDGRAGRGRPCRPSPRPPRPAG